MSATFKNLQLSAILLFTASCLLWGSNIAFALDPVQQGIVKNKVAPVETAVLLAGKWAHFPLVPSAKLKLGNKQPVPPVNPPHDGTINSDGWRRLLFNMNPVIIRNLRFSGFRFIYDGELGEDFIFAVREPPLGQGDRSWGMITQQGVDISFTHVLRHFKTGCSFQYKEAQALVKGQEYLVWFAFEFDFPVQLRFRIANGKVSAADARDYQQLLKAIADPVELPLELVKQHPLTHMGVGIGLVKTLGGDKPFMVTGTVIGTPAAKMALSVHSYITHVDGQSVKDMSVDQYKAIMQDPTKNAVVLTLRKNLVEGVEHYKPYDVKFDKVFIDGKDYEKLLQSPIHLKFAATYSGNAGANFLSGQAEEKHGRAKDAIKMYLKAAEQGEVKAMLALGRMYTQGRVEVDQAQATHWYTQAAHKGDVNAAFETASRFETGLGTKLDLTQAAAFYEQAAKGGHMEASTKLGEFYAEGKGVPKDQKLARKWLEQAGFQGNLEAAFKMGQLSLEEGNPAQAEKWFKKAALGHHIQASIELGKMFESGNGVKQDDIQASKWFYKTVHVSSEARYRYALILRKSTSSNNARIAQAQLLLAARDGYEPARQELAKDGLDWNTLKLPSEKDGGEKRNERRKDTVPVF